MTAAFMCWDGSSLKPRSMRIWRDAGRRSGRLDIEGPGPNTICLAELRDVAQSVMELYQSFESLALPWPPPGLSAPRGGEGIRRAAATPLSAPGGGEDG
jgi:hypothetical protein